MSNPPIFEITFDNIDEFHQLVLARAELFLENAKVAVGKSTLFGIAKIANDTPVDTGRLRASIVGDYGLQASEVSGDNIGLNSQSINDGKEKSVSKVDFTQLEGVIGTNVEYARHVEFGHGSTGPKQLTIKQRKFLFASGILRKEGDTIIYTPKGATRQGGTIKVSGRAMFRRNFEVIERYFHSQIKEAIAATREGKSLGRGGL